MDVEYHTRKILSEMLFRGILLMQMWIKLAKALKHLLVLIVVWTIKFLINSINLGKLLEPQSSSAFEKTLCDFGIVVHTQHCVLYNILDRMDI